MNVFRAVAIGILTAALAGISACASSISVGDPGILSGATVTVVTAREAGQGKGPRGISDRFTSEGLIYAFVSVVWPADHALWGRQVFESRWYSGDRLVVQRELSVDVTQSPFNFWSRIVPLNLGSGPARYELHADGKKLAEKSFLVVEQTMPAQTSLSEP